MKCTGAWSAIGRTPVVMERTLVPVFRRENA